MRNRIRALLGPCVLAFLFALFAFAQAPQSPREFQAYPRAGETANPAWPSEPVRAPAAMVVTDERLGSEAGVEILKQGGNAVDAAVAVAFALAVVEPQAGNIGGGGFMLVRLRNGHTGFVDYRETAPKRATRDMYLRLDGTVDPHASTVGYRSIGVPGTVAGLELALHAYGTKKLSKVMEPAIRLAEEGFPISAKLAASLRSSQKVLGQFPTSKKIFLKDGQLFQAGEILKQPQLAATLRRIAKGGTAEFYRGRTAHELADEMTTMGGLIRLEDLSAYRARLREPLFASYSSSGSAWELITSPPPSSGGIATIEALNILAPIQLKGWNDADSVHWVIETMRRVFADRASYLGDSDFTHVPVKGLTDPRYADELRATIDPQRATPSAQVRAGNPAPFDSAAGTTAPRMDSASARAWMEHEAQRAGHTTHFSVVDAAGDAVANTYTLNDIFGSGVTTADGFLLNDEMDDFTARPGTPNMYGLLQSDANSIGPGKRPLSSMMPTILLRDGKLSFVTGSPGGPQIISATLLSILNWMRLGEDAQLAINEPRFHQQWMPDVLVLESTFPAATLKELQQRGYALAKPAWIGEVEAIGIDPKSGARLGAPDPRRQGVAIGY